MGWIFKQEHHTGRKNMKRNLIRLFNSICIVILGLMVTACSPPQDSEPSVNNGSNNVQTSAEADIQEPVNVNPDRQKTEATDIDWEKLAEGYNLPSVDGLLGAIAKSDISADGSIAITADIKREFNKMGEDYRFFFMPKVSWYDFESTGAALSYILFTWTGEFGTFPEKAPKCEAEARLRKVFAAPNDEYPPIEHQSYGKCVMFDGESYSPWPESYNDNTMIYDLIDLTARREEGFTYYTLTANEYQFDVSGNYDPGENEKFLLAQADALELDYASTLIKLLETGEISAAQKSGTYTIELRIEGDNAVPKIVSIDML